jgi:undecaprenyl-diphosphatase
MMDYRLEQWINGPAGHHPTLDAVMRHAARWAEPAFVALIVLWFLVGWMRGAPQDRRGALTAGVAAALALLVNQVIIYFWQRPRPFVAHPGAVHVLLAHSSDPSFPSDHAAPGFAIAVVLLLAHRRLGLVAVTGAVVMSYARVYCGDHYPADVLAGALVGTAAAILLSRPLAGAMDGPRRFIDAIIVRLRLPLPAAEGDAPRSGGWSTTSRELAGEPRSGC